MRLISDEDLKDRASEYCLSEDEYRRFCKIIDAEPTACDMDNLRKIANCKELEEVTGIPLKELAEIFRQHIPNACQHPEKACVLTDGDVDKWRKYQQLDKHGRLIKLPCKVGDTVYQIFENFIEPCTVEVIFLVIIRTKMEITVTWQKSIMIGRIVLVCLVIYILLILEKQYFSQNPQPKQN